MTFRGVVAVVLFLALPGRIGYLIPGAAGTLRGRDAAVKRFNARLNIAAALMLVVGTLLFGAEAKHYDTIMGYSYDGYPALKARYGGGK